MPLIRNPMQCRSTLIPLTLASAAALFTAVSPAHAFSVTFTKLAEPAAAYPDNSMLGTVATSATTRKLKAFTTGDTVNVQRNGQVTAIVNPEKLKAFGFTTFFGYRGVAASADRVAVGVFGQSANDPQQTGLYVWRNGILKEVAKNGSQPLNGGSTVDGIANVSISGPNVAFTDTRRSPIVTSLFINLNGKLYLVQAGGARGGGPPLDGKAVQRLAIGPKSLQGTSIVFRAQFFDGSDAVYRADVTP
jgi:hypothetical protein